MRPENAPDDQLAVINSVINDLALVMIRPGNQRPGMTFTPADARKVARALVERADCADAGSSGYTVIGENTASQHVPQRRHRNPV